MKKILYVLLISFLLSGCSLFRIHKLDIEQGNIITQEDISRLHPGMSQAQVKELMGTPVLVNIFSSDRLDYVYTFQKGHGDPIKKRVTCIFRQGRLQDIQRN